MGSNASLISMAFAGASTISSSFNQAESARLGGDFRSTQLKNNAAAARAEADDEIKQGAIRGSVIGQRFGQTIGTAIAGFAGQGVVVGAGGSVGAAIGQLAERSIEAQVIENNDAWRRAFGLRTQATEFENAADFARIAGEAEATSTLVTGATSVGRDFANFFAKRELQEKGKKAASASAARKATKEVNASIAKARALDAARIGKASATSQDRTFDTFGFGSGIL